MNGSKLGLVVASAVASLIGSSAFAKDAPENGSAKACYRTQCGQSIKGYTGQCGGTKVEEITDQKSCETAGGAWVTAAEAEKYKH